MVCGKESTQCYKLRKVEVVEGPQALQDHTKQGTDAYLQRPCCGAHSGGGHPKERLWESHKFPILQQSPKIKSLNPTLGGIDGVSTGNMHPFNS